MIDDVEKLCYRTDGILFSFSFSFSFHQSFFLFPSSLQSYDRAWPFDAPLKCYCFGDTITITYVDGCTCIAGLKQPSLHPAQSRTTLPSGFTSLNSNISSVWALLSSHCNGLSSSLLFFSSSVQIPSGVRGDEQLSLIVHV